MMNQKMPNFTTYSSIVGQVLAQYRKNRGLEQSDMAEKTGITQSTWSRIERGESTLTLEQLNQIANGLGISPEKIMRDITRAQETIIKEGIEIERKSTSKKLNAGAMIAAVALPALAYFIGKTFSDKDAKQEDDES